ncbi:MAG: hypothetical protein IJL35_08465 [Bacteroidaceae bacterium]|nr:hypothetical protein [Bacteroidaceae bacterium]
MRKIISVLLLCNCISVLSQTTFDAIEADVRSWSNEHKETFVLNSKSPKTIEFPTQRYSIEGVISKGVLCEGTIAKFYDISSLTPNLLLEGKVTYNASRLIIDGIKYESTPAETNKLFGSFYVYNMDDYSMNYKAKKAGNLRIKCQNAAYLEGFYLRCPVIVSLVGGSSSVYVDGKTGGRGYSFLSAVIPNITLNDDESFDIYQILLQAKDDVTMCWENGIMFRGRVKPTPREDGTIVFYTLDGQKTGMTTGPKRITVSRENGNIVYTQEDNDDNELLSKETMYVRDDGTLSEMDYWNTGKIYENCYLAQWTYRNGNYFEGSIKSTVTVDGVSSMATNGVFKYPNGDRFEGDVSSKTVGPFFIDGTTYFSDGNKLKGNWLGKYKLSSSQLSKLYKCQNPSEAIALAKNLERSNYYQDYKYTGSLQFFDPSREEFIFTSLFSADYITYDKTNKLYSCRYDKTDTKIIFEFAVDNNGFRKWEIIYGNNNKPEYINEFTWYSNGEIESIKSYFYSTKKIYLSCNFFSDGKLRSAYQYGPSNSGENILRKSKESHPSFGGFTCKLYDLNGQYERSISWGIGEAFFGGSKHFTPYKFEFDKLEPIE